MKNATFLALQGPDGTTAELAPIAAAASQSQGRLGVLHLGPVPILTYAIGAAPYAVPVIPEGWTDERNKMAQVLSAKQSDTRAFLQKEGLTGEVSTLCIEPSAFHDLVAIRGLFADICIVLDSLRTYDVAFENVVYGLLFEAPGPVMLNVAKKTKALTPDNVFIAWDGSLPAARAVRAALPLLKTAQEVTIASFDADPSRWAVGDNPGSDLATWLAHHGCNVMVQEYAKGSKPVADAILHRARENTADLIVMGAYGRNRWNQRFFGGTTETMIRQQDLPVLIAH